MDPFKTGADVGRLRKARGVVQTRCGGQLRIWLDGRGGERSGKPL